MINPSPAGSPADWSTLVQTGTKGGDLSRLLDDQRRRWARGERVLVEDYLAAFPDVLSDPLAPLPERIRVISGPCPKRSSSMA